LQLHEEPISLLSEYISTFDDASVPAAVFASAVGNSAPGQTASAVKTFPAVAAGPSFNAGISLMVLSSIISRTRTASILDVDLLPIFGQGVFSSFYGLQYK
jgi:hypothetical protein